MLHKLRRGFEEEQGFTLIELLVVVLIIGILAAIALPSFLGQKTKGQDAAAKSDARNMVSQVESCYATSQDYNQCTALTNTGLDVGTGPGQVEVAGGGTGNTDSYTITAHSKSTNNFVITKTGGGAVVRTCTNTIASGGCPAGTNPTW